VTIGLDTNVLLRMLLNDDPEQRAKAVKFGQGLTETSPGFVSVIVLVELAWSLSSRYRQPKEQVLAAVRQIARTSTLRIESFDAVVRAIQRSSDTPVDFADALIAEHNLACGCSHTVTFDQDAARRIPSMGLLA
jgi:predicted nucleic-acid-binding protein